MKIHLASLFSLMSFISGCVPATVSTPLSGTNTTQAPAIVTPIVSTATVTILPTPAVTLPTSTTTPYPSTPTFISASLPSDLIVAYVVGDALWVWKQNSSRLLLQRQNISAPVFSDDGQWLLFRQRHFSSDGSAHPSDELWVVRTDGSEIKRLVGSDDLLALTGKPVLMDYFSWLPGHHKILFNTEEIIDGPPGSSPLFDLYSVDLAGQVTQLLGPGGAGRFVSSPDGTHVALATGSSIKVFDLETGNQRTLLEFEQVGIPMDGGPPTPKVIWDPNGQFVLTSILPKNLYYPEKYAGEPEQVWRVFINGQTEIIAELQPFVPAPGITFSPDLQHFFYLHNSCFDGMGMLYVYDMESAEEYPITCVWNLPQWLLDGQHFIYELDWLWQMGNISDNTNQPLDVLNVPTDPNVRASPLTWINNEYFLLLLRSRDVCTLNIATLRGVVTEIASTSPDFCPRSIDFSLPK
jgi:hypothetical protein